MLKLFFDTNIIWDILIASACILIFVICLKNKNARWFLVTILATIFTACSIFSGFYINSYYTSSGGIYGKLIQIIDNKNEISAVETITDISFDLRNVMLTETNNENEFSAVFTSQGAFTLSNEKSYMVYVNNMPCNLLEFSKDYVIAEYGYTFFDNNQSEIVHDTLRLLFAFDAVSTRMTVLTTGGQSAVNYWSYYFTRNNFIVKIEQVEKIRDLIPEVKFNIVTFEALGSTYKQIGVKNGLSIQNDIIHPDRFFLGWSLDNENIIDIKQLDITEDITVYAIFDEIKLQNYTWEEINEINNQGLGQAYFLVGDKKSVELSSGENVEMVLMGFEHDDLADGSGKAKMTFAMVGYSAPVQFNSVRAVESNYISSSIRNEVLPNILNTFPTELRKLVKPVSKKTAITDSSIKVKASTENLFLFSCSELGETSDTYQLQEGNKYKLMENNLSKFLNYLTPLKSYWTRDVCLYGSDTGYVAYAFSIYGTPIDSSGGLLWNDDAYYLVAGFCI